MHLNLKLNSLQESLGEDEMKLGFTFSFPMKQSSLSYGTLVQWTKGFENPGVVGKDVAELLNDALKRNQVNTILVLTIYEHVEV